MINSLVVFVHVAVLFTWQAILATFRISTCHASFLVFLHLSFLPSSCLSPPSLPSLPAGLGWHLLVDTVRLVLPCHVIKLHFNINRPQRPAAFTAHPLHLSSLRAACEGGGGEGGFEADGEDRRGGTAADSAVQADAGGAAAATASASEGAWQGERPADAHEEMGRRVFEVQSVVRPAR